MLERVKNYFASRKSPALVEPQEEAWKREWAQLRPVREELVANHLKDQPHPGDKKVSIPGVLVTEEEVIQPPEIYVTTRLQGWQR